MKYALALMGLVLAMGCGSVESTHSAGGTSTGGTGGQNTSGGGTTISGLGGTGGTTAGTTTTGGAACVIPGPSPCGEQPAGYPDPLASYNAAMLFIGALNPIPGTDEAGSGAGAVRLGPWDVDKDFAGFSVILSNALPDPVRFAVWSEPQCGLPADKPADHAQDVPLADVQQVDVDVMSKITITTPIHVPAGESVYVALVTTEFSVALSTVEPTLGVAPRAMWFGVVDNDCDGEVDPNLGWAYLDTPTAPAVSPYHYDLAFTLIEMAPPAPMPIVHGDCCPNGCKCPR